MDSDDFDYGMIDGAGSWVLDARKEKMGVGRWTLESRKVGFGVRQR